MDSLEGSGVRSQTTNNRIIAQTRQVLNKILAPNRRGSPAGFVAFLLILSSLLLGAVPRAAAQRQPESRLYLWVIRHALEDTVAFTALADSARAVGCTDLVVQVRGRGEAYYRSASEPAPRSLENERPPGVRIGERPSQESLRYDPLGIAIKVAHSRDMRIHAWFNVFVTATWKEDRPRHILTRFPDWEILLKDGSLARNLSAAERRRLALEGRFLDPGHPKVLPYLRGLARELAWRYAIDGIHFDYIRYPRADAGYGEASWAAFTAARDKGEIPATEDDPWDTWRISRVTNAVRVMAREARKASPAIEVSAAVMADHVDARRSYKQDWPGWLAESFCDQVLLMAYTKSVDKLDLWRRSAERIDPQGSRAVLGLGLHNLSESRFETMLRRLLEEGETNLALFSDQQFIESARMRAGARRFREAVAGN